MGNKKCTYTLGLILVTMVSNWPMKFVSDRCVNTIRRLVLLKKAIRYCSTIGREEGTEEYDADRSDPHAPPHG